MKKIKTIRVCGTDLKLKALKPSIWAYGGMGRFCEIDGVIAYRKYMSPSTTNGIILHECVHAICDLGGLFPKDYDNELFIQNLGTTLHAFIKDNPELICKILEEE